MSSSEVDSKDRVCIVIPPSPFLADERVFPSLGPLKVAASLEQNGVPIDVLDLSGVSNYTEAVDTYLAMNDRVDTIGLSATTPQFPYAVKILETIRATDPEIRVILGGVHSTMVGTAFKMDQSKSVNGRGTKAYYQTLELFDTVVIGDGELAIFEAIQRSAPKVIDAGSRTSLLFLQRGTLGDYPLPARDLIDFDSYHYSIDGKPAQSMIAQLGCPFECTFCCGRDSDNYKITRPRNPESVVEEVALLAEKYGMRGIMLYDDELNVDHKVLMETLEGLIKYQEKSGFDLRFRGFVKAELFRPQQAEMFYRAGFRELLTGVESGDDGILTTIQKHTSREVNTRLIQRSHAAGIRVKALMSIGHPGESEQSIQNSINWVLENKPDEVDWASITQYPGAAIFDNSVPHPTEQGVWVYTAKTGAILFSDEIDYSQTADYYKGVPGDEENKSYVWTNDLSKEDIVRLRNMAEDVTRNALGLKPIQHVDLSKYSYQVGSPLPSSILRGTGR